MDNRYPYKLNGDKLKALRGNTAIADFSSKLQINLRTYYRYENGERDIPPGLMRLAEIISAELKKTIDHVQDPEKDYDPHGGYKPDPEKALGIVRGTPHWMAFDFLSKIYASQDQQLIGAVFSDLKSLAEAAEQKRENAELKRKLAETLGQLNQPGIIRMQDRRSGADRRQVAGESPTEQERRTGGERRKVDH